MSMKFFISIALVSSALCIGAMAEDSMPDPLHARYTDCRHLNESFHTKEKDAHSSYNNTAHKIAHQADQFCRLGQFSKGVVLYERAINLLQMP